MTSRTSSQALAERFIAGNHQRGDRELLQSCSTHANTKPGTNPVY